MPFKSGDEWNGNPNGRPKGSGLCLTTLLKQHLEQKPKGKKEYYKDLFVKTLLHKALIEKDMQALKLVINYCDGLPKQALDLKETIITNINVIFQPKQQKQIDNTLKFILEDDVYVKE